MSKFPYIKWWQTNTNIFIEFLHKSINFTAEKNNNILLFKDNDYNVELDLLNDFDIDNILSNPKTIKVVLNKLDKVKWIKLLKNESKYKHYISTDWDKFLEDELEEENNNMMQGIDPSMFSGDQLQNLMSSMNNQAIDEQTDEITEQTDEITEKTDEITEQTENI